MDNNEDGEVISHVTSDDSGGHVDPAASISDPISSEHLHLQIMHKGVALSNRFEYDEEYHKFLAANRDVDKLIAASFIREICVCVDFRDLNKCYIDDIVCAFGVSSGKFLGFVHLKFVREVQALF
ncbi:hypothetical protein ACJX0J_034244 [Zea mays]